MYTGLLYAIVGLLITFSLLLYFLVRVLSAQGKALHRERMRGDIDRLDNLPPPDITNYTPLRNADGLEDVKIEPQASEEKGEDPFVPSTLRIS